MNRPAASPARLRGARLRRDLDVVPARAEGRDWLVVRNPSTDRYFRLSASAFGVLRDLDGAATPEDIARRRAVDAAAVAGIVEQARRAGILLVEPPLPAEARCALGSALSFEICAFDPAAAEPLIGRWLGALFARGALPVAAAAALLAAGAVWIERARVAAALRAVGDFEDCLAVGAALLASTVLHEAGHIAACLRFGGHVPRVGIRLHLLIPLAFADISAAWMFPRRQRIAAALGGVYFDALLCCILAILWALAPSGARFGQCAFALLLLIAAKIAVNLLPVLRLDGYWVLSEWMGIANLGPRAHFHLLSLCLGRRWRWQRPPAAAAARALCAYGVLSVLGALAALAGIALGWRALLLELAGNAAWAMPLFWATAIPTAIVLAFAARREAVRLRALYAARGA